jgi:hypothetical protein
MSRPGRFPPDALQHTRTVERISPKGSERQKPHYGHSAKVPISAISGPLRSKRRPFLFSDVPEIAWLLLGS